MNENPYKAPADEPGGLAGGYDALKSRRFQFGLKSPFILSVGMLAGGQTARGMLLAETPMVGGVPVTFSVRGEALFFIVGMVAAVAGMLITGYGPFLLRIQIPWRIRNKVLEMAILLAAAPMIGAVSAAMAFLVLGFTFFTVPREVFDFLTTKPQ